MRRSAHLPQASLLAGGGLAEAFVGAPARATAASNAAGGQAATVPCSAFVSIAPDGRVTIVAKNPDRRGGRPVMIMPMNSTATGTRCRSCRPCRLARYGVQVAGGSIDTEQLVAAAQTGAAAMLLRRRRSVGRCRCGTFDAKSRIMHATSGRSCGYGTSRAPPRSWRRHRVGAAQEAKSSRSSGVHRGFRRSARMRGSRCSASTRPAMLYAAYGGAHMAGGGCGRTSRPQAAPVCGVVPIRATAMPIPASQTASRSSTHWWLANQAGSSSRSGTSRRRRSGTGATGRAQAALDAGGGPELRREGDPDAALAAAAGVAARYVNPSSRTARSSRRTAALFKDGRIGIWAPSQTPARGRGSCRKCWSAGADAYVHATRAARLPALYTTTYCRRPRSRTPCQHAHPADLVREDDIRDLSPPAGTV